MNVQSLASFLFLLRQEIYVENNPARRFHIPVAASESLETRKTIGPVEHAQKRTAVGLNAEKVIARHICGCNHLLFTPYYTLFSGAKYGASRPLKKARPSVPSPQAPLPRSGVCKTERFRSG